MSYLHFKKIKVMKNQAYHGSSYEGRVVACRLNLLSDLFPRISYLFVMYVGFDKLLFLFYKLRWDMSDGIRKE